MKRLIPSLAVLAVSAIGCATAPKPQPVTAAMVTVSASTPSPTTVELYADLETAARDHEAGLELVAAGNLVEGRERIEAARTRVRAGAARCGEESGCDLARFVEVLDELLAQQSLLVLEPSPAAVASNPEDESNSETWAQVDEPLDLATTPGELAAAVPELGKTAALLRGSDLRSMIQMNPLILKEIEDWLTWRRPMLIEAWHNYHYLRGEIAPIYEEAGLPEALLFAMIATESGGKVHASSRVGAAGLLQFMRYTGARFGLGVVDGFDQRFEPTAATRAAVAYLDEQFGVLADDLAKALAAYNGGEGRMRGLHRRNPNASFWDREIYAQLPRETRDYVPRILAAAWLFLHPEEYRLVLPQADSGAVASIVLERTASLADLTICLGSTADAEDGWFRVLRNLNPRFESSERRPAGSQVRLPEVIAASYQRLCVDDTAMTARLDEIAGGASKARIAAPKPTSDREWKSYRVAQGDTLSRIAARNRCTNIRELGQLNNLRAPRYPIRVGQRLRVPVCS